MDEEKEMGQWESKKGRGVVIMKQMLANRFTKEECNTSVVISISSAHWKDFSTISIKQGFGKRERKERENDWVSG